MKWDGLFHSNFGLTETRVKIEESNYPFAEATQRIETSLVVLACCAILFY